MSEPMEDSSTNDSEVQIVEESTASVSVTTIVRDRSPIRNNRANEDIETKARVNEWKGWMSGYQRIASSYTRVLNALIRFLMTNYLLPEKTIQPTEPRELIYSMVAFKSRLLLGLTGKVKEFDITDFKHLVSYELGIAQPVKDIIPSKEAPKFLAVTELRIYEFVYFKVNYVEKVESDLALRFVLKERLPVLLIDEEDNLVQLSKDTGTLGLDKLCQFEGKITNAQEIQFSDNHTFEYQRLVSLSNNDFVVILDVERPNLIRVYQKFTLFNGFPTDDVKVEAYGRYLYYAKITLDENKVYYSNLNEVMTQSFIMDYIETKDELLDFEIIENYLVIRSRHRLLEIYDASTQTKLYEIRTRFPLDRLSIIHNHMVLVCISLQKQSYIFSRPLPISSQVCNSCKPDFDETLFDNYRKACEHYFPLI